MHTDPNSCFDQVAVPVDAGGANTVSTNPEASACLGITLLSGMAGAITVVLLPNLEARILVAFVGLIGFLGGIFGHNHFIKLGRVARFRPNSRAMRVQGYFFIALSLGGGTIAIFVVVGSRLFQPMAVGIPALAFLPYGLSLVGEGRRMSNQSMKPTLTSVTPSAAQKPRQP